MELADPELELLRRLRDQLRSTLDDADRSDPVVGRLFPQAVAGDADADAELRGLLRDDLLTSKQAALDELVRLLERGVARRGRVHVDLAPDEAMLVLGVLNDLRLAIGARVGIEQLDRDDPAHDESLLASLAIMDHFAWWQEALLAVLDPSSVGPHLD